MSVKNKLNLIMVYIHKNILCFTDYSDKPPSDKEKASRYMFLLISFMSQNSFCEVSMNAHTRALLVFRVFFKLSYRIRIVTVGEKDGFFFNPGTMNSFFVDF